MSLDLDNAHADEKVEPLPCAEVELSRETDSFRVDVLEQIPYFKSYFDNWNRRTTINIGSENELGFNLSSVQHIAEFIELGHRIPLHLSIDQLESFLVASKFMCIHITQDQCIDFFDNHAPLNTRVLLEMRNSEHEQIRAWAIEECNRFKVSHVTQEKIVFSYFRNGIDHPIFHKISESYKDEIARAVLMSSLAVVSDLQHDELSFMSHHLPNCRLVISFAHIYSRCWPRCVRSCDDWLDSLCEKFVDCMESGNVPSVTSDSQSSLIELRSFVCKQVLQKNESFSYGISNDETRSRLVKLIPQLLELPQFDTRAGIRNSNTFLHLVKFSPEEDDFVMDLFCSLRHRELSDVLIQASDAIIRKDPLSRFGKKCLALVHERVDLVSDFL